jgi:hypothetical protein
VLRVPLRKVKTHTQVLHVGQLDVHVVTKFLDACDAIHAVVGLEDVHGAPPIHRVHATPKGRKTFKRIEVTLRFEALPGLKEK